ncbi:MAG: flavodoxin [Candidatus Paceibacterota bacterium]|jgi:flavodoxin
MKKLVVYYSLEGNTKFIAEAVAKALGADVMELKPKKEISANGFMKYFWGGRQVFMKEKPELFPFSVDPGDYDAIIIGTPVWSFTFSPPIGTFFSKAKLSGKKIAPFCSHSGGMKRALEDMKKELKGNEFIGEADFVDVLKNKDENAKKAMDWAKKIDESLA